MNINDIWSLKHALLLDETCVLKEGILKKTGVPVVFTENSGNISTVCSRMPYRPSESAWSIFRVYKKDIKTTTDCVYRPTILHTKRVVKAWDLFTATIHKNDVVFVFKDKEIFLESFKNINLLAKNYNFKTFFSKKKNWKALALNLQKEKEVMLFTITLYN